VHAIYVMLYLYWYSLTTQTTDQWLNAYS